MPVYPGNSADRVESVTVPASRDKQDGLEPVAFHLGADRDVGVES